MQNNFYVYRHIRLDKKTPFYVGKGKNKRAWENYQRTFYWKNIAKKSGYEVQILRYFRTSLEAYEFEQTLIKLYKRFGYCEANLADGGPGRSGYSLSKEAKQRISKANSGKNNGMSKAIGSLNPSYGSGYKIKCLNTGKIYISGQAADRDLNIKNALKVARGERNHAGGYYFEMIYEESKK